MALDQLLPDYVGNAQRAYDQGKQRQQADIEQQKSELGELAGYLLSVPEEQRAAVWQSQVAPRVEKLIPGAGREAYGPHVADIAQWAVQEYGKQQQPARWQNLGNGYVMDGQGNVKQAFEPPKPQAKSRAHPINVPDGSGGYQMMMFDPDTQQVSPMNFGGQQEAPQQPQERVQFDFAPGTPPEVQAATRAAAGAAQPGAQEVAPQAVPTSMGYKPPPKAAAPRASAAPKPLAPSVPNDADAIDTYTADYIMHGKMPALGMGNSGRRDAVASNVARIAKNLGLTPGELLTKSADYKAGAMSLQNLQKQSDMLERNEQTFKNNADVMLHLSDTVGRSGVPAFNALLLKAKTNVAGDPDAAAFAAARKIVAQEYAKIASGATGSAGSTDSAQAHALELIDNAHTPAQLRAVVATLTKDADGQKAANKQQADEIRGRLKDAVNTKPAAKAQGDYSHLWSQ